MNIGFIGIGVMGQAMATHLLNAGHKMYVYNRTKSKADQIVEAGAIWCEDVQMVAHHADLIFTIIGVPADVEAVYLGEGGLIDTAKEGTILVDAPVTGGDVGAKNGTLTIMVGGEESVYQSIRPILDLMGKVIVYMGEAGSGQHTKMANQIAIAGAAIGMVEALAYSKGANLDLETVLSAITSGSAASWQLSNMAPRIIRDDFNPGFFIKHFIKDMKIATSEASEMSVDLPGLNLVLSLYEECANREFENLGTQALYKLYEK